MSSSVLPFLWTWSRYNFLWHSALEVSCLGCVKRHLHQQLEAPSQSQDDFHVQLDAMLSTSWILRSHWGRITPCNSRKAICLASILPWHLSPIPFWQQCAKASNCLSLSNWAEPHSSQEFQQYINISKGSSKTSSSQSAAQSFHRNLSCSRLHPSWSKLESAKFLVWQLPDGEANQKHPRQD